MDKIKNKDPRMQKAYQTIVYNRAVEQYHNREYKNAIANFELVSSFLYVYVFNSIACHEKGRPKRKNDFH